MTTAHRTVRIGEEATKVAAEAATFVHNFFHLSYVSQLSDYQNGLIESEPKAVPLPSVQCIIEAQTKNPFSLIVVHDIFSIVGVVELWALKGYALKKLLSARLSESDLDACDFRKYSQNIENLYIAITAPNWKPELAAVPTLRACLAGAFETLEAAYFSKGQESRVMQIYALEASQEGREMMEDVGFVRHEEYTRIRGEGDAVWTRSVTKAYLRSLQARYCNRRVANYATESQAGRGKPQRELAK